MKREVQDDVKWPCQHGKGNIPTPVRHQGDDGYAHNKAVPDVIGNKQPARHAYDGRWASLKAAID